MSRSASVPEDRDRIQVKVVAVRRAGPDLPVLHRCKVSRPRGLPGQSAAVAAAAASVHWQSANATLRARLGHGVCSTPGPNH